MHYRNSRAAVEAARVRVRVRAELVVVSESAELALEWACPVRQARVTGALGRLRWEVATNHCSRHNPARQLTSQQSLRASAASALHTA
jgi:hypothetical protein